MLKWFRNNFNFQFVFLTKNHIFFLLKDLEQNKHFWSSIGQIDYQLPEKITYYKLPFCVQEQRKLFWITI